MGDLLAFLALRPVLLVLQEALLESCLVFLPATNWYKYSTTALGCAKNQSQIQVRKNLINDIKNQLQLST